jgi:hypothetical protein
MTKEVYLLFPQGETLIRENNGKTPRIIAF